MKQIATSLKTMLVSAKKIKIKRSYVLATRARTNTETKNTQKFFFNFTKKTQNFIGFVNCKQKIEIYSSGTQITNKSLTSNANPKLNNFNTSQKPKIKLTLSNKPDLLKIKCFNYENIKHYAKNYYWPIRKKSRLGNRKSQ